MRSSAIAGFLASAVFVSGSAGFASTFLVGPYLGAHVRHQPAREALLSTAAPVDPLAAVQTAARTASLEGEPAASQEAHRLRNVENAPQPAAPTPVVTKPVATKPVAAKPLPAPAPTIDPTNSDPGPITEAAFATPTPPPAPVASGGPLIAAETSTTMMASKLENGEPVLTLRVVPVVAAAAPAADTDPDNAVEPTVISAPPAEQAMAAPALMTTASAPAAVAPTPAPEPERPAAKPRVKPALQAAAPALEPTHRPARAREKPPGRVTTIAAPAKEIEAPPAPVPAAPDPLNAPYIPPGSEEPSAATGAPASMTPSQPQSAPPPSSGGPTPLTMPQ